MKILSEFRVIICVLFIITFLAVPIAADEPMVERYLRFGELDKGERDLKRYLADNPDDDRVRFELGFLQFTQTMEHLGQSLYRHGSSTQFDSIPFIRFPVPNNGNPEPISYEDAREILETVVRDLNRTDETLSRIQDNDIELPLHIFQFYLDWNQNDEIEENEALSRVYAKYLGNNFGNRKMYKDKVVVFDKADVHWIRGYCSLLRGLCEIILAHDQRALWDVAAHRFFPKADVKFDFLREEMEKPQNNWWDVRFLSDIIGGVHMNMPLKDASRVANARQHVLDMIQQSRLMWDAIEKETDDNAEWIPSSSQKPAVTNFRVTKAMIKTWREFLDEAELVMNGEMLIPFWRGTNKKRGINLKKAMTHPRNFDIVLWIHGSGAVPYLEEGDVTDPATWRRFQEIFRGDFFGFAVWVN